MIPVRCHLDPNLQSREEGFTMPGTFHLQHVRPSLLNCPCVVHVTIQKTDIGKIVDMTEDDGCYHLTVLVDTVVLRSKRNLLAQPEQRDYPLGRFLGTRTENPENGETHVLYLFEEHNFTVNFGRVM
jgi:hypothetical protein